MLSHIQKLSFLFVLTSLVANSFEVSANAVKKGTKIAYQIRNANDDFVGESSDMEMILIDAHGSRISRKLKGMTKEVKGDGDKSISIFINPKDVKGTKMLTWSHKGKDDDQWLYLPSLRRVKRISSRNKSASFMGSEFSYEDLGSQEPNKYNFKLLKEGSYKKQKVWVLERTPKKKSGYSRMVLYVSKKLMTSIKTEYYDRKNELLKVAYATSFKRYKIRKNILWRANKIHIKNLQTKKESIISWSNRKLGVVHRKSLFNKNSLK